MNNLMLDSYIAENILKYLILCRNCNQYELYNYRYICCICKRYYCVNCNEYIERLYDHTEIANPYCKICLYSE